MDRAQRKLDQSHDEMTFTMQSPAERDAWMRAFPHPMPATHYQHWSWGTNALGQAVLTTRPELILAAPIQPPESALAIAEQLNPIDPAPPVTDALAKIEALSEPDLLVAAAENGVTLQGAESRAQIVALILDKLTAPATPPAAK